MPLRSENTRMGKMCAKVFSSSFRRWIFALVLVFLCAGNFWAITRAVKATNARIRRMNLETYSENIHREICASAKWSSWIVVWAVAMMYIERKCSKKLRKVGDEIEWVSENLLHDLYHVLVAIKGRAIEMANGEVDLDVGADDIAASCEEQEKTIGEYLALVDRFSTYKPEDVEEMNLTYHMVRIVTKWKEKSNGLEVNCGHPAADIHVKAHVELVGIVLNELVENAVKFTDSGSVNVILEEQSADSVSITVVDTGRGMSREECKQAFDVFRRGASAAGTSGHGIGLTLVHAIVNDLYRGKVELASEPGKGTTVTVTLPTDVTKLGLVSRLMSMLNPFGRKTAPNREGSCRVRVRAF